MERPAAGYLVITGGSQADAVLGATSPVAGSVELHETSTDASGMTGMHPISRLDVPAGATVTLQPGGYHLMFMQLTGTIAVGGTVQIDLTFEKAGKITVQAEVKQG
jgi:copper(I)-binding protein